MGLSSFQQHRKSPVLRETSAVSFVIMLISAYGSKRSSRPCIRNTNYEIALASRNAAAAATPPTIVVCIVLRRAGAPVAWPFR